MDTLIKRGVKTFKFLDRSFNVNIPRAIKIMEFFLEKIEEQKDSAKAAPPPIVHFEMVPSLFPLELRRTLSRFPPDTLRLEIGLQTLNGEVAARISRPSDPEKELEAIRWLSRNTNAIIHADLIAALPGEDLASFGSGFDRLWISLSGAKAEIQLGILKLLPGAPIARHNDTFKMRYNRLPPYEVEETSVISAAEIARIRNFARFWEIIVNRGLMDTKKWENRAVFDKFMRLSDMLLKHFGRNWGLEKKELSDILYVMEDTVT
jgi:radical SAM superfamily enzyme YgiQ (UPF0313 family)